MDERENNIRVRGVTLLEALRIMENDSFIVLMGNLVFD